MNLGYSILTLRIVRQTRDFVSVDYENRTFSVLSDIIVKFNRKLIGDEGNEIGLSERRKGNPFRHPFCSFYIIIERYPPLFVKRLLPSILNRIDPTPYYSLHL